MRGDGARKKVAGDESATEMAHWLEIVLIIGAALAGLIGSGSAIMMVWQRWRDR